MPFSRTEAVILQQQQQIQYGCRSSKRNRAAAQVQYHTTIAGGHLSGEVYTMRLPFEPDSKSIFIDREFRPILDLLWPKNYKRIVGMTAHRRKTDVESDQLGAC
jgi:hypothetical protein